MSTESWKQKMAFGEPTYIESPVGEKNQKFYPVSIGMMFQLRRIGKPLAHAIATLTSSGSKDTGNIFREVGNPAVDSDGKIIKLRGADGRSETVLRDTETIAEAITPELAEMRTKQRTESVETLINTLMEEENLEIVASIIMDSMRLGREDKIPPREFVNSVDLPEFTELIIGVCKANKGVFGPMAGKLTPLFTRAQEAIEGKIGAREDTPSPTPNGETSPTASSPSSSEGTPPSTSSD